MTTQLEREAREASSAARQQITRCADVLARLRARLTARPPEVIVTCARGSSDHAATYGKYVLETTVRRVVASVGPSVASLYAAPVSLERALFLAVSQSGKSPDILQLTEAAKKGGALVVGLVNDETSPLAELCDVMFPLCAGPERAVAATKSYLMTGLAFLQLAAAWSDEAELHDAVARAPEVLAAACEVDVTPLLAPLATATSAYVVARGIGLGAAAELALKLKETCRLHAEAFSTAEVLHGPVALVSAGFPVLALAQDDETAPATSDVIEKLTSFGARVTRLGAAKGVPALLAPLAVIQSCYLALPALAAARGLDADAPVHLRKVTETV